MTGLEVLARVRASAPAGPSYPSCDLCGTPIAEDHGHVADLQAQALRCACRACGLLFDRPGLALRTVPSKVTRVALDEPAWEALGLPVGTAFVIERAQPVAVYPGPAGATESAVDPAVWEALLAATPGIALRPDVEALLVHTQDDRTVAYVVPVDRCYALVGLLRTSWRGFDGGSEAQAVLAGFLADLERRAGGTP